MAPGGNSQAKGEFDWAGGFNNKIDPLVEWVIRLLGDGDFLCWFAQAGGDAAGCVEGCDYGVAGGAEPDAGGVVWHDAVDLAGAAGGVVVGLIGHSRATAGEEIMIRVPVGDYLVGAGEILQGFEVVGDGGGCGVEAGSLNFVGVLGLAGGHEQIAEAPGVVGDVAGFVAVEWVSSAEPFGGTAYAVDEHVEFVDLAVGVDGGGEVFFIAGVDVEDGWELA